jgi:hypothetical protein
MTYQIAPIGFFPTLVPAILLISPGFHAAQVLLFIQQLVVQGVLLLGKDESHECSCEAYMRPSPVEFLRNFFLQVDTEGEGSLDRQDAAVCVQDEPVVFRERWNCCWIRSRLAVNPLSA